MTTGHPPTIHDRILLWVGAIEAAGVDLPENLPALKEWLDKAGPAICHACNEHDVTSPFFDLAQDDLEGTPSFGAIGAEDLELENLGEVGTVLTAIADIPLERPEDRFNRDMALAFFWRDAWKIRGEVSFDLTRIGFDFSASISIGN